MCSSLLTETANGRRWLRPTDEPSSCWFARLCKQYQHPEVLEIQKLTNIDELLCVAPTTMNEV